MPIEDSVLEIYTKIQISLFPRIQLITLKNNFR